MFVEVVRHVMFRRRVDAVHAWRDAQRLQAAEHRAAVGRIIAQAPAVPDPVRAAHR